jgi:hypothetical protein
MILTEPLPDGIEVDGERYAVYTDYCDWIKFEKLLEDDEPTETEKATLMLDWYIDAPPPALDAAIKGLVWFFRCGVDIEDGGQGKQSARVYDYEQDAQLIYAAFRQAYNIDLSNGLHWWVFRACLNGMPDVTRLAQIMGIRGTDTSAMSQRERKHYEKLKSLCALKGNTPKPKTLADRDAAFLAKVKRKR